MKTLKVLATVMVLISLLATAVLAASGHGMAGMSAQPSANPAADRAAFLKLWPQAVAAGGLTPELLAKLTPVLSQYKAKLAENYTALDGYRQQKAKAAASQQADLNKRIELKEDERDLIVAQAEQALKEFLTAAQLNLFSMAAFHGVSQSHGDTHQGAVHGGMNTQMSTFEQMTMDLGQLAGKMNTDCKAVTLDIILDWLKMNAATGDAGGAM